MAKTHGRRGVEVVAHLGVVGERNRVRLVSAARVFFEIVGARVDEPLCVLSRAPSTASAGPTPSPRITSELRVSVGDGRTHLLLKPV